MLQPQLGGVVRAEGGDHVLLELGPRLPLDVRRRGRSGWPGVPDGVACGLGARQARTAMMCPWFCLAWASAQARAGCDFDVALTPTTTMYGCSDISCSSQTGSLEIWLPCSS